MNKEILEILTDPNLTPAAKVVILLIQEGYNTVPKLACVIEKSERQIKRIKKEIKESKYNISYTPRSKSTTNKREKNIINNFSIFLSYEQV